MTMKKLLSAGLIAVLCFASTATAFAGTAELQLKEESVKAPPALQQGQQQALDVKMPSMKQGASSKAIAGDVKIVNIKSSLSELKQTDVSIIQFDQDEVVGDDSASFYRVGYSKQVTLSSKGMLYMQVANSASSDKNVTFGLYKDAKLSQKVDYEGYADKNTAKEKYIKVPAAGTYYVGIHCIQSKTSDDTFVNTVGVGAAFVSGADRTVTSGKSVAIGAKEKQSTYLKFKAASTGYITVSVNGSTYFSGSVALYNSSKKALSKDTSYRDLPTYGVKKGSTYYIKVIVPYPPTDGIYYVTTSNKAISESSGSSKSKAKSLSAKKTRKGTITAGSSTSDWYKFKLSSKRNYSIIMKGKTNDQLKIAVYDSKGKQLIGGSGTLGSYSQRPIALSTMSKFPKGTYYIKVYRGNAYSSGWYSLYWK